MAVHQTRVVVSGTGTMGKMVMNAVEQANDLNLVGVFSPTHYRHDTDRSVRTVTLPPINIPYTNVLEQIGVEGVMGADVVVDFTHASVTERLLPHLIEVGVHPVIGTSGLSDDLIEQSIAACSQPQHKYGFGGVIAPNFSALGALMMHLSRIASRFPQFADSADIVEMHHDRKGDAPSGTAVATAYLMHQARGSDFKRNEPDREPLPGARGAQYGGISIHSRRLPGAIAHQEVTLGGRNELLTIRHDSTNRESFMPGVLHAIRAVQQLDRMVVGLGQLLDL